MGDEAREAGHDRTIWRVCADNGWWSVLGKKRAKNGKKPGRPAHDDLVRRAFTATAPNRLCRPTLPGGADPLSLP